MKKTFYIGMFDEEILTYYQQRERKFTQLLPPAMAGGVLLHYNGMGVMRLMCFLTIGSTFMKVVIESDFWRVTFMSQQHIRYPTV